MALAVSGVVVFREDFNTIKVMYCVFRYAKDSSTIGISAVVVKMQHCVLCLG